jgi:hypothetical protein
MTGHQECEWKQDNLNGCRDDLLKEKVKIEKERRHVGG